jgi:hypothetical protein
MKTRSLFALPFLLCALPMQQAFAAPELWFHLRATEHDGSRARVTINLPYSLVEKMGPLMDERSSREHRIEINGREITADEMRAMWSALKEHPNAPVVSVIRDGERVTVEKEGDALLIRSEERGRSSEVRISGGLVTALLSSKSDELDFTAALHAMGAAGAGELLVVHSDDSTVHIWVDGDPEGRVELGRGERK